MYRRWCKKDQRFFCVTFNNLGYNLSLPAGMTGTGMLLKQDISKVQQDQKEQVLRKKSQISGKLTIFHISIS